MNIRFDLYMTPETYKPLGLYRRLVRKLNLDVFLAGFLAVCPAVRPVVRSDALHVVLLRLRVYIEPP